ncbi:hypothetical protein ACI2JA_03470 [Alkalihalobacillus sp. NPDC078783]
MTNKNIKQPELGSAADVIMRGLGKDMTNSIWLEVQNNYTHDELKEIYNKNYKTYQKAFRNEDYS